MTSTAADTGETEVERLRSLAWALATRNLQLEHALGSRVTIEQAKGMLAERHSLSVDDAFEALRQAARSNRMRLRSLAEQVLAHRETPPEIVAVLVTDRRPSP